MTKTNRFKAFAVAATALALCLLALIAVQPARAAFPGTNGKIAFESVFDIWVKNATPGSPETKLLDGAWDVAYSPDGSRIAFVRESPGPEIFVVGADGKGTPTRLTENTVVDDSPAWSPDGTKIVYESGVHIWQMNADGNAKRALTTTELPTDDPKFDPTAPSLNPSWSVPLDGAPDGKIAFGHGGRLWTMLADGSAKDDLGYTCPTENGGICDNVIGAPTFSPDGTRIAANYYGDVFTVPSSGGTSTLLLQGPESGQPLAEQHAAWSPDGASIAFQANPRSGGQSAIYVAPASGTTDPPTMITSNNPGDVEPEWQTNSPTCDRSGGPGDDTLASNPAADEVLCGLGGNDTMTAQDGDILMGGDGNDKLSVAAGRATLNGGAGKDTASFEGAATEIEASLITGFAQRIGTSPLEGVALVGIENLTGSPFDDDLTGSVAANKLVGGDGADTLLGLGGTDTIISRDGVNNNDTVNGGSGTDRCTTDKREASIKSC